MRAWRPPAALTTATMAMAAMKMMKLMRAWCPRTALMPAAL
jgi:hypothetical protein